MPRTYVIADAHGRLDLVTKALAAVERHAGDHGGTFICLGDFVDRGPASRSIIELFIGGPLARGWSWIILQGNHEDIMLQALADPRRNLRWWVGNGGADTLMSYGYEDGDELEPSKIPDEHVTWLSNLPLFHRDQHRLYVHAGVPFDTDPAKTSKQTMQWMLYPGDVKGIAETYPDRAHESGLHTVHGHHQSAKHPLLKPHRTNLDAFGWQTGALAVGVFDDDVPGGPTEVLWAIGEPA